MDTTDGPASPAVATAAAAAELSDSEPENEANSQATSTGADDSLQASMASIDQIETEMGAPELGTKDRSESRASLPPVESSKDSDLKKKKSAFSSLSKSTFKKFSPKIKASDIKSKMSNNKVPSSPDVSQKQAPEPSESNETTLPSDANESTSVEQATLPNDDKPHVSNGSTPKSAEPESTSATQ